MLQVKTVASIPWEGEKRRPEIRLLFTGYRGWGFGQCGQNYLRVFNNFQMRKDFSYYMSSYVFTPCFSGGQKQWFLNC